jgi:hypothetical protein
MKKIILALVLTVSTIGMANAGSTYYYGSSGTYLGNSYTPSSNGYYQWPGQ